MLTEGLIPYTTAAAMAAAPKGGTNGQLFVDSADANKLKFIKPDGTISLFVRDGAGNIALG